MSKTAPETIYLKDYRPFGYVVDNVHLTFDLHPGKTRVTSRIRFRPGPDTGERAFFLHGEGLKLISARIDGIEVKPEQSQRGLTCKVPDAPFLWEAEVEIDPEGNTALEGLYMSPQNVGADNAGAGESLQSDNAMYCSQCEAEGFRKITYYPDRPDVMAIFTVRINGPHPVLLSNGNPVDAGKGWAEWHDPWPKPAYLFALVAGDLVAHRDSFTTGSGRAVALNLWVRPGDEGKCAFGMAALKKSMLWDEQVYGREYDLEVFNIVAVDDFNMGAMENKGLNIFNSSAVLASPETATDGNFERIEAIIAHEYFHNWTGNRITCRDWFQLCLKEGLTVFRDAQFTADMRSAPVKRIGDVMALRARQFAEDNGPLAHPVRPASFQEINNFYTATVYEKGAEVIGMLKRLVGDAAWARALELYFARHDGQACTIEDWLAVFQEVTGRDLRQFKRWYSQAGTPRLKVQEHWADGRYTLRFSQSTPPSAASPDPQPQVIPIEVGLIGADGQEVLATRMLEMTQAHQSFTFDGLAGKPVPSILRGFSAPVILELDLTRTRRAFLLANDTDPFNRWEAGRVLARTTLMEMASGGGAPDGVYLDGMLRVLRDDALDPAYRALMLALPGQAELAAALHEAGTTPDPQAIWTACEALKLALAQHAQDTIPPVLAAMQVDEPYRPDARQAGKRALGGAVLALATRLDGGAAAAAQFARADNMTLQMSALACLLSTGKGGGELAAFRDQWQGDRLVMDKWFGLQVMQAAPGAAVRVARALSEDPDFNWHNPNRFRAVFGALIANHAGFHAPGGAGYVLLADWLIRLDPLNPQTTARMCGAFQTWARYDKARQALICDQLARIAATPDLSRDTSEMISRIRGA